MYMLPGVDGMAVQSGFMSRLACRDEGSHGDLWDGGGYKAGCMNALLGAEASPGVDSSTPHIWRSSVTYESSKKWVI
jgi:hypothetical protein